MNALQTFIASLPCGFITSAQMPELIRLDRLCPVLVRCGGCRFTCAAQDVEHLLKCITAGGDYVRDVSLPVGSMERAANWIQEESIQKCVHRAQATRESGLLGVVPDKRRVVQRFNENDCGGVFDGHQVISDADSGL